MHVNGCQLPVSIKKTDISALEICHALKDVISVDGRGQEESKGLRNREQ